MERAPGFSIVELLILVVVVVTLSAFLLPKVLDSRKSANEGAAISTLILINRAQQDYRHLYPQIGYAKRLEDLSSTHDPRNCVPRADQACLLEYPLAHGDRKWVNNYWFSLHTDANGGYVAGAAPRKAVDGTMNYCVMQDSVVRWRSTTPLLPADQITADVCRTFTALP